MMLLKICIICLAHLIGSFFCQTLDNYLTRMDIMEGLIFPNSSSVYIGEDVFLRLTNPIPNQTNCTYRMYDGEDIDISQSSSNQRIVQWIGNICGIQIKNVTVADSGHWRLTSRNNNNMVRGLSLVVVNDTLPPLETQNFESATVDFAVRGTQYCYVLRPDQQRSEFPMHNHCLLPTVDNQLDTNGLWTVVSGIAGRTEEFSYVVNVENKVEDLYTEVIRQSIPDRITLVCNLINSNRTITFCRFLRVIDDIGFNVGEGQGHSKYKYAGNGLNKGQCGITIEEPDEIDLSTWKCYLGVNTSGEYTTIGALLDLSPVPRTIDDLDGNDVYAVNDTSVNVLCKSLVAIDYCWFLHPNGERISVSDRKRISLTDKYRYFGTGLKLGECGITIVNATINDSGIWRCNVGTVDAARWGAYHDLGVRISESHLTAVQLHQDVVAGQPIIIECTTIPFNLPIEYCRFVLPDGSGFGLNEAITAENALSNTYYFNPNRQLNMGYCSLIVRSSTRTHHGKWTCAATLAGRNEEYWDDFQISINDQKLSVGSIIGLVFGLLIVMILLTVLGIRYYRKRRIDRLQNARNEMSNIGPSTETDDI